MLVCEYDFIHGCAMYHHIQSLNSPYLDKERFMELVLSFTDQFHLNKDVVLVQI